MKEPIVDRPAERHDGEAPSLLGRHGAWKVAATSVGAHQTIIGVHHNAAELLVAVRAVFPDLLPYPDIPNTIKGRCV